jgi:hypothetical protein
MIGATNIFIKKNNRIHLVVTPFFFWEDIAKECKKKKVSLVQFTIDWVNKVRKYHLRDIKRDEINKIVNSRSCRSEDKGKSFYSAFCADCNYLIDFSKKQLICLDTRYEHSHKPMTINLVLNNKNY